MPGTPPLAGTAPGERLADLERLLFYEGQELFAVLGDAQKLEALVFIEQPLKSRADQRALVRDHHRNRGSIHRQHLVGTHSLTRSSPPFG